MASVVKFDRKPFFLDDLVVGTAVEYVGVAIDFVALAHGNQAGKFFGENFANLSDIIFGNVLADVLDVVVACVSACKKVLLAINCICYCV